MKKLYFLVCFNLLLIGESFCQQEPHFTQYGQNLFYVNPAASGMENKTLVQAIYRNQYLGYNSDFDKGGTVQTQLMTVNMPMAPLKGGLGLSLYNYQFSKGIADQSLSLSYAYQHKLRTAVLAIGTSVGLINKSLNGELLRPRDQDDPLIPNSNVSKSNLDLGFGVMLSNPTYNLGLSIKHFNKPSFELANGDKNQLNPTLNLSGSVLYGVSYTLDLSPMFLIRSDLKTISPEAGLVATYNSKYWLGANYRYQDASSILVGGSFLNNSLRISYALDLVTFGTETKSQSSHELLLSYSISAPRSGKKSIIRTPRYRY
jgi:type IX secretion system PorP/SprF family membrane protein